MNLKDSAVSGVKWTTVSTIITTLVGILRVSILTRILDKSDFGVVAIITFVLGLTQMFADIGFSSAIMLVKDLSKKQFCSLYWIQFIVFLFCYGIICAFSAPISSFYGEPILVNLLPIALIDLLINGVGKLYGTLIQKDFQFQVIAVRNIVSYLISLIVAVLLAILGYGVYSLVLSTLTHTILLNAWNFIAGQSKLKLSFYISIKEVSGLFKIGIYQTLTSIVDYVGGRIDVLIIGKLLGTEELGVFSICKELIIRVYTLINNVANNVTLPFFAKIQDNKEYLRDVYCKVLKLLSFVSFPVLIMMAVFGEAIVTIMYGEKFIGSGTLFSILAISYLPACIVNPAWPLAVASGRTDLSLIFTIIKFVISCPLVYYASTIGINAVAISFIVISLVSFAVSYLLMIKKYTDLTFYNYCNSFSKNLLYYSIVGLFSYVLVCVNPLGLTNMFKVVAFYGIVTCILCVCASVLLLKNDKLLLAYIPIKIRRFL